MILDISSPFHLYEIVCVDSCFSLIMKYICIDLKSAFNTCFVDAYVNLLTGWFLHLSSLESRRDLILHQFFVQLYMLCFVRWLSDSTNMLLLYRKMVQQITGDNYVRRSGNMLPPPVDDYFDNEASARKIPKVVLNVSIFSMLLYFMRKTKCVYI